MVAKKDESKNFVRLTMAKTALKTGLTGTEVKALLARHGPNEIKNINSFSSLKIFFSQLTSPLIYILVFAGLVAFFLHQITDALVIFVAVLINTFLGFYQEKKAQKTLAALKTLLVSTAEIIRDGGRKIVNCAEVVPGDLVVLTMGDRICADGFLVEATDLTINEAILTGESLAVGKKALTTTEEVVNFEALEQGSRVFAGTTVVSGKGVFQVVNTGQATAVGQIGGQIREMKEEKTPLQEQLARVAKLLALVVGVLSSLIFLVGKLMGYATLEIFMTSVAVAVAAIPEGLAVTLTVILALGMQNILKKKAIVRKLLAAETLGSVSVICADKTGTLTEGKMRVVQTDWQNEEMGFLAAVLCSEMRDPIGVATWEWARKKAQEDKINIENILEKHPRLAELPFSPQERRMATLHPQFLLVAGAPEILFEKCQLSAGEQKKWQEKFENYARQGFRLVGFAAKKNQRPKSKLADKDLMALEWLGILIYEDPIREGVKEALLKCQQAGIKVKVITGDFLPTAVAVMEKLGLDGQEHALTGEELSRMSNQELAAVIDQITLFARTTPEQKLKIVRALKGKGEVVAMTGDGVNDALALKMADIGIVVGEASDVAKESADVVLLDSNFATIVYSVEEGRTIFENIKKVVLFLLSDSFTEIILIGGSLLLRLPLPVTAAQILWVNLIEDALPGIALAFEKEERGIMAEKPRPRTAPILDIKLKTLIFVIGISTDLVLLGLFYWLQQGFFHLQQIQTVMFVALAIDSLFIAFACRSLKESVLQKNLFSNRFLLFSLAFGFFLLISAVYFPPLQTLLKTHSLGAKDWIFLLFLGIFDLVVIELAKQVFIFRRKWIENHQPVLNRERQ